MKNQRSALGKRFRNIGRKHRPVKKSIKPVKPSKPAPLPRTIAKDEKFKHLSIWQSRHDKNAIAAYEKILGVK